MKRYVDGFVLPIPKDRVSEYEAIAEAAAKIWKEHGALEYRESIGDDLEVEGTRSFVYLLNVPHARKGDADPQGTGAGYSRVTEGY